MNPVEDKIDGILDDLGPIRTMYPRVIENLEFIREQYKILYSSWDVAVERVAYLNEQVERLKLVIGV